MKKIINREVFKMRNIRLFVSTIRMKMENSLNTIKKYIKHFSLNSQKNQVLNCKFTDG